MSTPEEEVYLSSDSESDDEEFDNDRLFWAPPAIKLKDVNVWEERCCITVSPISNNGNIKYWKRTIPTMNSLNRHRIEKIFNTFN